MSVCLCVYLCACEWRGSRPMYRLMSALCVFVGESIFLGENVCLCECECVITCVCVSV